MKDIRKIQDSEEFEKYFRKKLKEVELSKDQKKKILDLLEDLMIAQRPHPKSLVGQDYKEGTIDGINLTYRLFSGNCINFRDILDDEVL